MSISDSYDIWIVHINSITNPDEGEVFAATTKERLLQRIREVINEYECNVTADDIIAHLNIKGFVGCNDFKNNMFTYYIFKEKLLQ